MLLIVLLLLFLIPINKKKSASPSFLYHVDYAPSNSVVIKNILPVADSLGKTFDGSGTKEGVQGYTEITISNTDKVNHEYYILIDKQDSDSEINGYYVKFYLTDNNDSPIDGFTSNSAPVYDDLLISKNKINVGKIIKIIRVLTYVTILSFIMIYPVIDKYRFYSTLSDFVYQYTGKILLSGRNIIWQYYIQRIRENPFFGYGLDFAYNFTDSVSSVHNSYLNMLLQVGFVGLICVFLLINYVLVRLEKSNNKGSHTIEVFTLINLVMCTTEVMLLQGQVVLQIIIWVLMGVGLGLARKEKIE